MTLRALLTALLALPLLALAACSGDANGGLPVAPSGLVEVPVTITQGRTTHRFTAEVARSEAQQATGLMNRAVLAADRAMLFPFPQAKFASFWMHNTLIPLDILFIRADGTIDRIAENAVPNDDTPIASGGEVTAVLELPGGTAARLDIDETAIVRWPTLSATR